MTASGGGNGRHGRCGAARLRRPAAAWLRAGVAMVMLVGCSRDEAPSPAPPALVATPAAAAAAVADGAALLLPDIMEWVVDPAAAVLAAAADQHGWVGLSPRSDEAWQAVVDAAAELVRSTDLLVRPGVAQGQADWLEATTAVREGALAAAAAARRRDPRGLYLAGQQVRAGCQGCHARHAPALALTAPPVRP